MANCSAYAAKLCLDFLLNTQTATRPTAWWMGLSYGTPTSVSASEIAFSRVSVVWSAASTSGVVGTTKPTAAVSFSARTYASTVRGYQVWDASTGGNMLWYGLLSAATRPSSLSGFTFPAASVLMSAL